VGAGCASAFRAKKQNITRAGEIIKAIAGKTTARLELWGKSGLGKRCTGVTESDGQRSTCVEGGKVIEEIRGVFGGFGKKRV